MKSGFLVPLMVVTVACTPLSHEEKAVQALAERIVPEYSHKITFEQLDAPGGKDYFELESNRNKLVIRGNNANSMAVGLNHYLKYYCMTEVSWFADEPVTAPARMPVLQNKISQEAKLADRFFLNYCTYGYTMVWWDWNDWERLIDWMALNGVNLALATTGQEAAWYQVWTGMGLTHEQVMNYFTGPAHLPWHRINNLDYYQSPFPQDWLSSQADLQKKIVARERELNITPVLQAFAGHVPAELGEIHPEAKINTMSRWGGFADKYRSHFLDPLDPLFAEIQKSYLEEQAKLFGTDHIYGADPFNEVDPPSWDPEFLARVSNSIYSTMKAADPDARWLQMTWLFYMDRYHWTDDRIEAYLKAIPGNSLTLLDYYCDNTEVWSQTDSFHGQPYIWCYLGNFGGNTSLAGNFDLVVSRLNNVFENGGENFTGLGSTLEGLDVNPFMYEYVFERAWSDPDVTEWFNALADQYLGKIDETYRQAWQMLHNLYIRPSQYRQGTTLCTRPQISRNWILNTGPGYDKAQLVDVWSKMLQAGPAVSDSYNFWIVNVGRQALGDLFDSLRDDFEKAYNSRDIEQMKEISMNMLAIASDIERLVARHPEFSFNKWIEKARAQGKTQQEMDYYEINARTIVTTWGERGQELTDYANRCWSGLVADYYIPRWKMFFDAVIGGVEQGSEVDFNALYEAMADFEAGFATSTDPVTRTPAEDTYVVTTELYNKYFDTNQTSFY